MNTDESLETSIIINQEIKNLQTRLIKVQNDLISEQKRIADLKDDLHKIANKEAIDTLSHHRVELAEMKLRFPLEWEERMKIMQEQAKESLMWFEVEDPPGEAYVLEREGERNQRKFKNLNLSLESHVQEIMNLQICLIKVQDQLIDARRSNVHLSTDLQSIEEEEIHFVKLARIIQLESRAVNAENQVNEHRRQVEAADERWARKRAHTDDLADKSLQLIKVEAELVWQRQNKSDADTQLNDLRRHNHELEQTIWGLERGIDSQMTRAKLEYESKLAALEHRLATLTDA
jgi:hypothetical protein